jgi:hypothetical protein
MLVADVLVEIDRMRRQELLREREHDALAACACAPAATRWRGVLARSLHALAARIEAQAPNAAPPPPVGHGALFSQRHA